MEPGVTSRACPGRSRAPAVCRRPIRRAVERSGFCRGRDTRSRTFPPVRAAVSSSRLRGRPGRKGRGGPRGRGGTRSHMDGPSTLASARGGGRCGPRGTPEGPPWDRWVIPAGSPDAPRPEWTYDVTTYALPGTDEPSPPGPEPTPPLPSPSRVELRRHHLRPPDREL